MKRKFLTILIVGVLCISMVACNKETKENSKQTQNKTKQTETKKEDAGKKFENLGIEYKLPDKWKAKEKNIDLLGLGGEENIIGQLMFSFIATETMDKMEKLNKDSQKIPETDKVKMEKFQTDLMNLLKENKELCTIVTIDKSKTAGKVQKELFAKFKNKDLLGKEGNFEIYLLHNDVPEESGLSDKSKKDFKEVYGEIKNFKSLIKTSKPVSEKEKLNKYKKFEFKTKTLDGKEIDSSIFKGSKLTMINIWATYCGPCIQEMPDLQKLYEEVKGEKINVIGLVSDTPDEDNEELAKKILEKKGAKFTNIIPDESIKSNILKDVSGVPTTLFVDSEGNIVGDFIVGSHSKEDYKNEIQARLKSIKN
ncbi:TlpA family protein disulfide reductase [Clostridium sp. FP1]|uniref:TlpA family protein disulfide reductase n=1 Tax=Clostridium sp. FP1 TaxID=2724076 RepID=UPI0013E93B70|nr:TlpA disulfide reductase family protein [Clostridium sp. FP1]MBZ9633453.1 TlpA family protein disulfide reductase [Clostridium sp. FP1]